MNWTNFQTYNESSERAFEMLCNQLFENWCKDEYKENVGDFTVVNGSGGDGGVESYATLKNNEIVGLQAKWFPTSLTSSQIQQIKGSITTALKIRPQIKRYIVCVPRDLSNTTAKGDNTEAKRWADLCADIKSEYTDLDIEMWNETRIVTELQKASSAGIMRFWFEKSEISNEVVRFCFEKAKDSWLSTKYIPELNTYGKIERSISFFLGQKENRRILSNRLQRILKQYKDLITLLNDLIDISKDKDIELKETLENTKVKSNKIILEVEKFLSWLSTETNKNPEIDEGIFRFNYDFIIEKIKNSKIAFQNHFHVSDVVNILSRLSGIDFYGLMKDIKDSLNKRSLLFLGEPGTGKTHGIAASAEKLLKEELHIPIVVQARDIPQTYNWKDILVSTLSLSASWSEEEIWQALTCLVNRNKFENTYLTTENRILPKVVIIVDGIDESAPYQKWFERIKETNTIIDSYPQIRFCFTSRPFVFTGRVDYAEAIRIKSDGDAPAYKLFDNYINAYNISAQNKGWLKQVLTTPLSLKLFCEVHKNKSVSYSKQADVSILELLRKKIEMIEDEVCLKMGISPHSQYTLRTIKHLSFLFLSGGRIERLDAINKVSENLNISVENAEKYLEYLENYGIIRSFCEHGSGLLEPDSYFYYPGIQGYFDYASAILLMEKYEHPKDINFADCKSIDKNTLYELSIISMQNYNYLITTNNTINSIADEWLKSELQFFALRHTSYENAHLFRERLLEMMPTSADALITVTNKLILPLSRDPEHPLGPSLLDEVLLSFEHPAKRDIIWSVPGYLRNSIDTKWYMEEPLNLADEEFLLSNEDVYNGCPLIYTWALSTVNNTIRKQYRESLMKWARMVPCEFYKLFLKFSMVNDPQIRSDLFSILMCIVYDYNDVDFTKMVSEWILENILHPNKIEDNRDISIRYYSIAIINKAIISKIYNLDDVKKFLPPYSSKDYKIPLDKGALSGTRMGGYSGIDYDLSRYVLIDHFQLRFMNYSKESKEQFDELIKEISNLQEEYKNINIDQFILSSAFAYITSMGWSEKEFQCMDTNESGQDIIGGVDISIGRTYRAASHGAKSAVMTVCEKYVWQARNYISGFLSDKLLLWENDTPEQITDYGMLDDFLIPIQEIQQIDPDNIPDDRAWHVPEPEIVIVDGNSKTENDIINNVINAPDLDWEKWIIINNPEKKYVIQNSKLIGLYNYSCFYGSAGVETCLFINAVLMDKNNLDQFISLVDTDLERFNCLSNPTDLCGSIKASCYITPKEVCWFPWKGRYNSYHVDEFSDMNIDSAVDECTYNFLEYGDVYYHIPSQKIRDMLEIVDSNGYIFYDNTNRAKAEYSISGEKWRTAQNYLLVPYEELKEKMDEKNKTLVWFMRELRREDGKSCEKFGEFYAMKDKSYIGYFKENYFYTKQIACKIDSSKK
ncbi:MAG: hypothetical protein UIM24_06115 [Clostridia bacterium]|nr:hypothetical protein [Clostridia bacterium]